MGVVYPGWGDALVDFSKVSENYNRMYPVHIEREKAPLVGDPACEKPGDQKVWGLIAEL